MTKTRLQELREKKASIQWTLDYCAGQLEVHRANAAAFERQIDALRFELATQTMLIEALAPRDLSRPVSITMALEVEVVA